MFTIIYALLDGPKNTIELNSGQCLCGIETITWAKVWDTIDQPLNSML